MDLPDKYKTNFEEGEHEILPNIPGLILNEEIDKEEFKGFFSAQIQFTEGLTEKTRFNVNYILDIHKVALKHLYTFAGKYRTVNVSKGGFLFPAAKFLPEIMNTFESEFLSNLPDKYDDTEILIKDVAKIHAELLFIHPFREGNGRVARLLADLMVLKAGYNYLSLEELRTNRFKEYIYAVQMAANKDYSLMEKLIGESFEI